MFSVVCFKWARNTTGFKLPAVCDYGADHVNKLYNMVKRNLTLPHRFICITDDWVGLNSDIEVIKLWDKCLELGGCYNRLFVFDKIMGQYLGDKFLCIDLDCVIVSNIDELVTLQDDFVINEYPIERYNYASHQYYNGGLFMMQAGARQNVWDRFQNDRDNLLSEIEQRKQKATDRYRCELVGSDQAVISHVLGDGEKKYTEDMGVYDYMLLPDKNKLPDNAKIVFFAGQRDPSTKLNHAWVKENWR